MLELWVHTHDRRTPPDLVFIRAEIPDGVSRQTLDVVDLPMNWDMWPHPESTRMIGDDWLSNGKSCLMFVPSAITKVDYNCLVNPQHDDFGQIEIYDPESLSSTSV